MYGLDWCAALVILVSKWLLSGKDRRGWILAGVGNLIFATINAGFELWGLVVLAGINLCFCVRGYVVWGRE